MPSTVTFHCNACGAALEVDRPGGKTCAYCGSYNEFVFSRGEIEQVRREVDEVVKWVESRKPELDAEFQEVMQRVAMGERELKPRAAELIEAITRLAYAPTLAMLAQPGFDNPEMREQIEATVKLSVDKFRTSIAEI
ncbi:MAG: hypothetical protein AAFX94_07300 [Myxococcota bacterium]